MVEAWRAELWRRREQGDLIAVEIVPAARTVLLDGVPDPTATAEQLTRWASAVAGIRPTAAPARTAMPTPAQATTAQPRRADHATDVVVPVVFDGPDLPAVAEHWGVDVPAVRHRLTGTRFRVAFCGFAPGFAYLTGLPAELALPRLATPRPGCRPARSRWPARTPASTRPRRPAAGCWSAGPTWCCST